ncbi:MAG: Mammalian cell entry related domain protein [Verrucomicrobia bacterium]|nr:Mammalian cell entry related domain protein [Verrucomicrobiota bacterium]
MKTKFSPTVIGAFVLGGFALIIIGLLSFGGVSFFSRPQRFVVYFDESIHGLDLGSPVKLRGVRVGRVVALNIRYDGTKNHSVVAVVCEFSKNMLTDTKGGLIDVSERGELQNLVDRGLRAQLGVLGLATGLLFVELDFLDPKDYPTDNRVTEIKYTVVPAVPSAISEFQASASEILANLQKVDFAGISMELKSLLATTRRQIDGVDLKGLVTQWKQTGAVVEATANAPEIKQTFANLNGAISDLRGVLAKLDTQVMPAGKELTQTLEQAKQTLASFNLAAADARRFIAAQGGLGDDVTKTLSQLGEAADAVQRLADFLERNPNALITGKKRH